jgi:hypothetical protein
MTCPEYVGIAGATNDPNGFQNPTDHPVWAGYGGTSLNSDGGVLPPLQSITIAQITDGTSNVMVVSEESTNGEGTTGARAPISSTYGWMIGMNKTNCPTTCNERIFNLTTVRYAPNNPYTGLPGVSSNYSNNGLYSQHAGGVQSLMGDGAVRFISENLDLANLKRLCVRDDGQPVGEF